MYLRLENITKRYETKLAVDNLSLQVPQGAIYGIIGPNGAGKTTTIRMIMNIIAPDSGTILFDGKEIDDSFRNRAGYLPEERGLYKKMTLNEIILYLAELKDCRRSQVTPKIGPWLERMGLAEYRMRKVEELSKGMAQKLQFITTIIHDPDIVILDELFSGLDPVNTELLKDILLELKRDGKTILFSTHVMEQAEKLCDYVCMINAGQKVIDGRMAEVKAQFGKNSLQVQIQGDGSFIKGLPEVKQVTDFGNYLELMLHEGADADNLLKAMIGRVRVRRFEMMEPSLYQIFIDMAKIDPSKLRTEEGNSCV